MKYDSDLIETMYLLQQSNPALAERMWNRLVTQEQEPQKMHDLNIGYGLSVPQHVVQFMQRNHSRDNKVMAIKALREQTGWGLKDAKDAVDLMIARGLLD